MRDYWLTRELLQAAGIGLLILALIGVGLALWLPKKWWAKLLAVLAVGIVISTPLRRAEQKAEQQRLVVNDYQQRFAKAQALFDERCKTAGERIYRTVEGVEGVLLLNLRPEKVSVDNQFERYDPYGYESGGDDYIKSLLPGHWRLCTGQGCPREKQAFRFVESKTERGAFVRYTTVDKDTGGPLAEGMISGARLLSEVASKLEAKFGVRWEDISTDSDRQAWIAGGKISIYDLETMTVIAERIGFFMDTGQGSTLGARSPWSWARRYTKSCPAVDEHNMVFVRKVLKSSQVRGTSHEEAARIQARPTSLLRRTPLAAASPRSTPFGLIARLASLTPLRFSFPPFHEATGAFDSETTEAFAKTVNQVMGKVTMLFITHPVPKSLRVDAVLRMDKGGVHQLQAMTELAVAGQQGQGA